MDYETMDGREMSHTASIQKEKEIQEILNRYNGVKILKLEKVPNEQD
jgi:hypothetical protein